MRARFLFVLSSLLPSAIAQWHIAPGGSDAGAGTAADPFATIAHAAAVAAAGDTLYLHAGSYGDEQGLVALGQKDLVLQGDGRDSTTLHAHSVATALLDTTPAGAPTLLPHHVGLLIDGPARVHVRDLTVDGSQQVGAGGRLVGIWLQGGADCLFDRVQVTGCRPAVLAPGDVAKAVVVHGDVSTDPTSAVLRACRLGEFAAVGLQAEVRADVDLQECEVRGAGADSNGLDQVGVLLQYDAVGRLRHGRLARLGGASGTAILLRQQAAGCAVEGNRIGGTAIGIDIVQAPPMLVPGSVRGNRVAGADTALRVQGDRGLAIADNSLFTASARDPLPVSDDTAGGNQWLRNRYAVAPASGPLLIPGGGNADPAPRQGCSELGDVERIAVPGLAPLAVQPADFDGDGQLDFAVLDASAPPRVGVARRSGGGFAFASLTFGDADQLPVAMVVGEFDGQPGRDLCVLVAPRPPAVLGGLHVLANDGSGGFTALHFEPLPGSTAPAALAAGNFNGNGVDDLVVGDRGALPLAAGGAEVLLNDGTGSGWFGSPLPAAFAGAVTGVATGDFDGDHKVDVALVEGAPALGLLHLLRGTGVGSFTVAAGSPWSTPANPLAVAIADFDRDGDQDVLASAVDGALPLQRGTLLLLERLSSSWQPRRLPTDLGPMRIVSTDLDDDATPGELRPELLLLDLAAGNVALFGAHELGTGFVGGGLCTGLEGPTDLAAGDFDGDPWRDAIGAEPGRGGVAILHGRPTQRADTLGRGCPGSDGLVPRLELRGAPALALQPNLSLQLGLADAPPFELAVLAISPQPAPVLAPCGFLLASVFAAYIGVTDVDGRTAWNLPVPPSPDVRGLSLCMQVGTHDPAATTSFFPGFGLTALLRVRVGD